MDYAIAIFGFGLIVTFLVFIGLIRAAEYSKSEAARLSGEGD